MTERISAKVAQILTARELVLNKGELDGVRVGMKFAILNRKGADIVDPDTKEPLGSVELPKTFVKVISTKERLAVGRTFRTFSTGGGPLFNLGRAADLTAPPRVTVETLRTDETTAVQELPDSQSFVQVGDPAIEMVGDELAGASEER